MAQLRLAVLVTSSETFVAFVIGGVIALLTGLLLTRLHWRRDIPPYGRNMRLLDVTRHPERYAENAPFGLIRALSAIGALLLAAAGLMVVTEIIRTSLAR